MVKQGIDAPRKPGRPREKIGGRKVNVYLAADAIDKARRLGHGSMTRGIEVAIRSAPNIDWHPIVRDEDAGQG